MKNATASSLPAPLRRALDELGYTELTEVQARALPPLLAGRDLLGQSHTGSGKTLAFGLPLLARLELSPRRLRALILCPTRELCDQVTRELRRVGRHLPGLQVLPIVGGQPFGPQQRALARGVHIAVGTPGRVLDHLRRQTLDPRGLRAVVLDEADRMLDMGFAEEMEEILAALPGGTQNILFSATFPAEIEEISHRFQRDAVKVILSPSVATPAVEQFLLRVRPEEKIEALHQALGAEAGSALVFCNQKATVANLAEDPAARGLSVLALHGDLEQVERDKVMAQFRNESVRVLVATDVAARGIDVSSVDLVVNFDIPPPETFVHRVGRTGRAGRHGKALTLALEKEKGKIREIEARLKREFLPWSAPEVSLSEPAAGAKRETLFIGGGRKDKIRPGDILGALTGEAGGFPAERIGKIEIHDRFSYVAVDREIAASALERLRAGRIKGRRFRVEKVK
jgi:ATP-independent RNA helicase DbpA